MSLRAPASQKQASPGIARGIVLAGVHAWSRCPLDHAVPRPLLPLANRALISYVLDWLREGGIQEACVCGNSQTDVIRDHLSSINDRTLRLHFYADYMPRGPAGCIRDAARPFSGCEFVVVDGTIIPRIGIRNLLAAHADACADLTVVIRRTGGSSNQRRTTMTPVGVYVFSESALSLVAETGYQDIKEELIPRLHESGLKICAYVEETYSPRVTGADTYLAVNDWMVVRSAVTPARLSADMHPTVRLIGPVVLGRDVSLGAGVIVVGPTSIGSGSVIGDNAIVCRSCVWDDVRVAADCRIDRSVLTRGTRVPRGAQLRNAIHTPAHEDSFFLRGLVGGRMTA